MMKSIKVWQKDWIHLWRYASQLHNLTIHAIYKAGKKQSVRTILQVLNMATLIYIEIIEDEDAIFIMTGRHFFQRCGTCRSKDPHWWRQHIENGSYYFANRRWTSILMTMCLWPHRTFTKVMTLTRHPPAQDPQGQTGPRY